MNRQLLTGNAAAAWGARLADVDYLPVFPITPQTEIIETLSRWINDKQMPARLTTLESEHSMLTAAGAGALAGARVFTATSSQGLLYAMEMLYTVSGWRAPFVLVNVSRGLASPITLEPDHNDILAARDSGFLQIHCSTCQEVVDSILIAYRLGEDKRVRLPVIVNLDGFYLSFTREPVEIPDADKAKDFLPPYDVGSLRFRAGSPNSEAVAVLGGSAYSYFRYEAQLAAGQALSVFKEAAADFAEIFGRTHNAIEGYQLTGAEIVFVMMGSFATKAIDAVDNLRGQGKKVGLARLRLLRPLPIEDLRKALLGRKAVIIVDQNLSIGMGGILQSEVSSTLYGFQNPPLLLSFIGGLGGRDISTSELAEMATLAEDAINTGEAPPPRLLYTKEELAKMRSLQAIAGSSHDERKGGAI